MPSTSKVYCLLKDITLYINQFVLSKNDGSNLKLSPPLWGGDFLEATLPSGDFLVKAFCLFISSKNPERFLLSPKKLHPLQLTASSPLKISYPERRFHLPTIFRGNVSFRVACLYSPKPEKNNLKKNGPKKFGRFLGRKWITVPNWNLGFANLWCLSKASQTDSP